MQLKPFKLKRNDKLDTFFDLVQCSIGASLLEGVPVKIIGY